MFGRSIELYEEAGAPFETARTRVELASVLAASGQRSAAERELRNAIDAFRALGATHEEQRAVKHLHALGSAAAAVVDSHPASALTKRQTEIVRLVAQGMSNPEIAKRLRLSDHTVKRHVANLLTKLGLSSRAAAAAYAAQHGLL